MNVQEIRPILSALLRNRTGAVLVALQVAIALAVLVNAVYVVKQRVDKIGRPTGIDVENIFVVTSAGFGAGYDHSATVRDDLAWLRGLPGVRAAALSSGVPLSGGGSSNTVYKTPEVKGEGTPVNYFLVDEQGVDALGTRLVAGRAFRADEILPEDPTYHEPMPSMIVTRALARALFGTDDAVGKVGYDGLGRPITVIGVIDHMQGSWVDWDKLDYVGLLPRRAFGPRATYLVRTAPGQRDALMKLAEGHLSASNPKRMIQHVRALDYYRDRSYRSDRNMAIFLVVVTVLLACVTALGIFALATFNVSVRTRQIGTRRAVGARRADVVRYFMVENWLITTAGVLLGAALALAVGYSLSRAYQLPRLDLYYLVGGVVALWALGQAAAWQPARRAARISPAVATRTV
ncbi:MAG: Macrolide export ATP-binding/permease protein MacB [Steroidobacteraceae bacterium]|nr:Macrolide export ATP-binding/permease protein MacB [Steroidobacteraceae bacterium]